MATNIKHIAALFCIFVLFTQVTKGQKVALVLSGGGARGLAHVGVIKALEEQEIPIDYIVGTSMGALVGGFYAAGYSVEELEMMVKSGNIERWVKDKYAEANINDFFYSMPPDPSMIDVDLFYDSTSFSLKKYFLEDVNLNFVFSKELAQASVTANNNFDSLMIPFRCIASEVFTEQEVVLKKGELYRALRASMSVPLVFRPIKIDEKYLFDGGIYNNFPVDVALREFNPDYIIGINVSEKTYTKYPYEQDEKLIARSPVIFGISKSDIVLAVENGTYIAPNVASFDMFSFDKADIIDSGYVATMQKIEKIKFDIESKRSKEEIKLKRKKFRLQNEPLIFKDVRFINFNYAQVSFMKKFFNFQKKGFLTLEEVKQRYFKLISMGDFKYIYPDFKYDTEKQFFYLELRLEEKNLLRLFVGGGLGSHASSGIYLKLQNRVFSRVILHSFLSAHVFSFYDAFYFSSRAYFPQLKNLSFEVNAIQNYWNYDNVGNQRNFLPISLLDRQATVAVGAPIGKTMKLLASNSYIYNKNSFSELDNVSPSDTLDQDIFNGYRFGLELLSDSRNEKVFPQQGRFFSTKWNMFKGKEKFIPGSTSSFTSEYSGLEDSSHVRTWYSLSIEFGQYFQLAPEVVFGVRAHTALSNLPDFMTERATRIMAPEFLPTVGSRLTFLEEYGGRAFIGLGMDNIYTIFPKLTFMVSVNLFQKILLSSGMIPEGDRTLDNIRLISSASLVYKTPIGPLSLNATHFTDSVYRNNIQFFVNIGYLLFHKRAVD